jgi:hypothetical protein
VCRLVWPINEVRHPDDFIPLVVLDHFGLLNDRHEVFRMANLALQSAPDLQDRLLAQIIVQERSPG